MTKEFVLIHADWCGPCQSFKPIIDKVSKELGITIKKVNMDSEEFAPFQSYVRALPTMVVLKDGELYTDMVGVLTENQLRDFIKDNED